MFGYEMHFEFTSDTIAGARMKMTEVLGYIGALGEGPDSCCLSFNDPDAQAEYEKRLSDEMRI